MSLMIYCLWGRSQYLGIACCVWQLREPLNNSAEIPIKEQNIVLKSHASVEFLPASL